jgi:hypothetical protein
MAAVDKSSGHGEVDTHAEHERPEDWGWHADLGKFARAGGYISIVALLIMLTATHYNHSGSGAILIVIGLLVVGLIWDRHQRKTNWR